MRCPGSHYPNSIGDVRNAFRNGERKLLCYIRASRRGQRDATDLARLTTELLRVVDATVQPEFIGLWFKNSSGSEHRVQLRV
jgi:hypothetical protein